MKMLKVQSLPGAWDLDAHIYDKYPDSRLGYMDALCLWLGGVYRVIMVYADSSFSFPPILLGLHHRIQPVAGWTAQAPSSLSCFHAESYLFKIGTGGPELCGGLLSSGLIDSHYTVGSPD